MEKIDLIKVNLKGLRKFSVKVCKEAENKIIKDVIRECAEKNPDSNINK